MDDAAMKSLEPLTIRPIHPFLFALFHILFLYSINVEQLSYSEIILPSTVALGFTLLLVLLSKLIFRDGRKVAIIISISLILFFSYGHIYYLTTDWHIGEFAFGRHRYLLVVWGLVFSCSTIFFIKTRKDLQNLTSTLNFISLTLVLISLLNIGVYEFKTKNVWQDVSKNLDGLETHEVDSGEIYASRDIYYIVLDGYASSSTLDEIYHFDNSNFTDYLSEKGFFVASSSRSNYANTFLSLASSLNMQYVNHLSNVVGEGSIDRAIPYQMIEDSDVMNFLKMQGYKFIHFSSGWGATDRNRYADLDLHYGKGMNFYWY